MGDALDLIADRAAGRAGPALALRPASRFERTPAAFAPRPAQTDETTDAAAATGRAPQRTPEPRISSAAPSTAPAAREEPEHDFHRELAPAAFGPPAPGAIEPERAPARGESARSARRRAEREDAPALDAGATAAAPRVESPADVPRAPRAEQVVLAPTDLLAEHIAPALVKARAITPREASALVAVPPGRAHPARRDGRIPVAVPAVQAQRGTEVHVHIDRIEISRANTAPPAPAPARAAPIDHADYLARQRDRWTP